AVILLSNFLGIPQVNAFYEFAEFRLDAAAGLLYRNGERVPLTPKAVDLLLALVEARGHPLDKSELLQKVWPDTAFEDGSLTWHISLRRKALEDGEGERRFIETLPRRGYRFVADVHAADPVRPAPSPHRRRTWHLWTAFACFALAAALVYL